MTTNVYKEISNFGEQFLSDKKVKETFKTSRGLKSNHHKNVFLGFLNANSIRKIFVIKGIDKGYIRYLSRV